MKRQRSLIGAAAALLVLVGAVVVGSGGIARGASGSQRTATAGAGSIAVSTQSSSPGVGIYRFDPVNHHLTRLTKADDQLAAWSRDGKRIAFVRKVSSHSMRLFVMNSDGSHPHAVLTKALVAHEVDDRPSWGPGDRQIVLSITNEKGGGTFVVKPDGTGLKKLSPNGTDWAWSPDGQTILFDSGGGDLSGMRPDGSGVHVVIAKPQPAGGHIYSLSEPAWSPDGKQLAFLQTDLKPGAPAQSLFHHTIVVSKADGSGRRTLVKLWSGNNDPYPTWSPDGRSIAFTDFRGNKFGVFAVSSAGGKPRLLLASQPHALPWFDPSWGPTNTS